MPVSELLCGNHEKRIFSNKIYTFFTSKRRNNNIFFFFFKCHHLRQDVFRVLSGFWTTYNLTRETCTMVLGGFWKKCGGWTIRTIAHKSHQNHGRNNPPPLYRNIGKVSLSWIYSPSAQFSRRCRPCASKSASQAILVKMQTNVRSCDSPNTPRRFALGASNVFLVGENPTCSVPAL